MESIHGLISAGAGLGDKVLEDKAPLRQRRGSHKVGCTFLGRNLHCLQSPYWLPHFKMKFSTGALAVAPLVAVLLCLTTAIDTRSTGFTIAATGDYLGEIYSSDDASVEAAWDLVRGSDFSFFNMEGNIFELATFDSYPGSENGKENGYGNVGGGAQYEPDQAAALSNVGFTLASHANNHAFDWLEKGMFLTHENLVTNNITFAGAGASLQEARAPAYLTENNITIALVAAAGTHEPAGVASSGDNTTIPRPGLSVLRAGLTTLLTPEVFEAMKTVAIAQGQELDDTVSSFSLYVGQFPYLYSNWALSPDGNPGIQWDINADDYGGILDSIKEAAQVTKNVFFSFHGHESFSGATDDVITLPEAATVPAGYIQNITRSVIEAGAAAVFCHGPHHLRGVEIYQGKPIFYSLSSMSYSLGLNFQGYSLPIEWDDSIIAVVHMDDGVFDYAELHPIIHSQLLNDSSVPEAALPKIAPTEQAERILGYLQDKSSKFGTDIKICGEVGYVIGESSTFSC